MTTASKPMDRRARMLLALQGLSVGDAFGQLFFAPEHELEAMLLHRRLPPPPWSYTDDTEMAVSVTDVLMRVERVVPDRLAHLFAERYDVARGYGLGARELLSKIRSGANWQVEARSMFGGKGSFGNGAAMRVAPVGAFFADDIDRAVDEARLSALPTHQHPEGIAGAIAVAAAAAHAWRAAAESDTEPVRFLKLVASCTPDSETKSGILMAAEQSMTPDYASVGASSPFDSRPAQVASVLGSGGRVSAQDTVPFALWCASRHLHDYREALWATASGLGDVDTTCAIVGGIVSLAGSRIPPEWLSSRELLPPLSHGDEC